MQAQVVGRPSIPQLFGPQFVTHSVVLKSINNNSNSYNTQCSQLREEMATLRDKLTKLNGVHYT